MLEENATFLIKSTENKSFGTGFCFDHDEDGSYILTCQHVVDACGKESLYVDEYQGEVQERSESSTLIDLAVVYVKGLHCTPLKLSLQPIVAGNIDFRIAGFKAYKANEYKFEPLEGSVKKISKIHSGNESIDTYELSLGEEDKIEKGYSGSAIVSKKSGQVIAVATDRVMSGKQAYAIPLKYLKEVWHELNPKLFDTVTPFVGLSSFNKEDRNYFFGRDEEVQELIQALKSTDISIIIGDSGSGKSSFAKAGVIPTYIDNSNNPNLYVIEMRPARNPFVELARFITKVCNTLDYSQADIGYFIDKVKSEEPQAIQSVFEQLYKEDNSELVLYVDQFEELFTMCDDKTQKKFIELLLFLLEHQNNYLSIKILLTMRRDYYNLLREYHAFYKVIETETYLLRRMKDEQLKEVIEKPLEMLSVNPSEIEQLSNIILWDLGDEAKEITLLQIALTETWLHRAEYNHDILEAYVGIGRVTGALSFLATNTLEGLSEKEQELFKYIFIRIVKFNDIGGITRRLADRDEFSDEAWKLVQKLASIYSVHQDQQSQLGRLLKLKSSNTKDDEVIELVHEALTTQWATYVNWIKTVNKENRKRIHNVLIDKSKEYKKNPESKHLLSGYALEESRKLLDEEYRPYLSKFEKSFIEKSNKSEARTIFWKRFGVGSLVVLLGLSGYFGYEAHHAQNETEKVVQKMVKVVTEYVKTGLTKQEVDPESETGFKQTTNLDKRGLPTFNFIIDEFSENKDKRLSRLVGVSHMAIGQILEQDEKYEKAIESYKMSINDINLNNAELAYSYICQNYMKQKQYTNAIDNCRKALEYNPMDDKRYYALGFAYAKDKNYEQAIKIYNEGLAINPENYEIYIKLGLVYGDMGFDNIDKVQSHENAIKHLNKAISLNPKIHDTVAYRLVLDYYSLEKHKHAIEVYEKMEEVIPDMYHLLHFVVLSYAHENRYEEAITLANKIIENSIETYRTHTSLIGIYFLVDDYEKSIESYKRAIEVNATNYDAYHSMGDIYVAQGDYTNALAVYDKAMEANKQNEEAYTDKAYVYKIQGLYGDSIKWYRKALDVNSTNENVHTEIGNVYYSEGNYSQAMKEYKEALELNSKNENAHSGLGNIHTLQGNYSQAMKEYKEALELNSKNENAHSGLGNIHTLQGNYPQAMKEYKEALELNSKNENAHIGIGNVYYSQGNYPEAIKEYDKALEINPKSDYTYTGLGHVYNSEHNYSEAIKQYNKALQINPKNGSTLNGLAMTHYFLQDYPKSIEFFRKSIALNLNNSSPYTNLFELQLTQNEQFDKTLEAEYKKRFKTHTYEYIYYEMLLALQNIVQGKEADIQGWKTKYQDITLGGWRFDELDKWSKTIEHKETQTKLQKALAVFKAHKNN